MSDIPDPVGELFGMADLVSPVNRFLEAKEFIDKAKWCCGVPCGKGEIHDFRLKEYRVAFR